jgi:hypothetical protein
MESSPDRSGVNTPWEQISGVSPITEVPDLTNEELRELFKDIRRQAEKCRKTSIWMLLLTLAVIASFIFTGWLILTFSGEVAGFLLWLPAILASISIPITATYTRRRQRRAIKRLANLNDVRAIGPLADVLSFTDAESRAIARDALVEILPRLKATDSSRLDTQRRSNLGIVLKGQDIPLMMALLKAYQQIGDERDLPFVERLLEDVSRGGNPGRAYPSAVPQILQAVLDCLPFIEARTQYKQARQTLLRASGQPPETPNELLRPTVASKATDPQQLLRSSPDQDV